MTYTVTTIAGSGSAAWADGTGTASSFNGPDMLAINSNGVIYIPDVSNNRIRTMTGINVCTIFYNKLLIYVFF